MLVDDDDTRYHADTEHATSPTKSFERIAPHSLFKGLRVPRRIVDSLQARSSVVNGFNATLATDFIINWSQ